MKKYLSGFLLFGAVLIMESQVNMTPEQLIQLGRVSAKGITNDGNYVIYSVKKYNINLNEGESKTYKIALDGERNTEIVDAGKFLKNVKALPDGKYYLSSKDVKMHPVYGKDVYPELDKSEVMIYDDLNYRHWDTWEDGAYSHVFLNKKNEDGTITSIDIMPNEFFDCPQKPFGGDEDYLWSPDYKNIIYVTKKSFGKDYAESTNTDIYSYNIESKTTTNLTNGMEGFDTNPAFSSKGVMAWLSMSTYGHEADKNDLIIKKDKGSVNLTAQWDGTVNSFKWSYDAGFIYFIAASNGTVQLFKVNIAGSPVVEQVTKGKFDVRSIVGQVNNRMVVSRSDMNHATELYIVNLSDGSMKQLTHVNDAVYENINLSTIEERTIKTKDGKDMLVWVIYPPNFDASKKYPTILYCQGGPQSAMSQFYSFRWNFQLMAANGYIIVAPNRRGMPGHGVEWNASISKDYGGKPMQDFIDAIDSFAKEPFVDKDRLGAIGASFGGYAVFQLAGTHQKRFKTFVSHDGIFNWESMYGTTEEMWFVNWDIGGAYWEKNNTAAQKSYSESNPINYVENWDTPILIIQGGKDYRVPIGQGLEAFQAAKLNNLKSRLLFFPNENHWVLKTQNSLIWHREFYKWLKETL